MQAFALGTAAVFSVMAIIGVYTDLPSWVSIISLVIAGVCLLLWLRSKYLAMEDTPIELDDEQRATIRRMKAEGKHDTAVRQIQLWFRNTSYDEAAAVMREI